MFDRLWRGDLSDYGDDHSGADDGFVHKLYSYTQDEERIKRIHAASGLHRPEKSGKRADYLGRSITRARKNVTWFYEWPGQTIKVGSKSASGSSQSAGEVPDGPPGVTAIGSGPRAREVALGGPHSPRQDKPR